MRLIRGWVLAVVCVVPLVLATGCTGSDVLENGNTTAQLQVVVVNSDNRFNDNPADRAEFQITAVVMRPPEGTFADDVLGVPQGGIDPLQTDLRIEDATPLSDSALVLASGRYRVLRIRLSQIILRDVDFQLGDPGCSDYRPRPVSRSFFGVFPSTPETPFLVSSGNSSMITVQVDLGQMIDVLETAWPRSGSDLRCSTGTVSLNQNQTDIIEQRQPTIPDADRYLRVVQ